MTASETPRTEPSTALWHSTREGRPLTRIERFMALVEGHRARKAQENRMTYHEVNDWDDLLTDDELDAMSDEEHAARLEAGMERARLEPNLNEDETTRRQDFYDRIAAFNATLPD